MHQVCSALVCQKFDHVRAVIVVRSKHMRRSRSGNFNVISCVSGSVLTLRAIMIRVAAYSQRIVELIVRQDLEGHQLAGVPSSNSSASGFASVRASRSYRNT